MIASGRPGGAVLVAAAVAPVPLLLYRRGGTWSVPALAPLLALAGLAAAYPALVGGVRGALSRAALGALGAWWALLAAPVLGRALLGGVSGAAGAALPVDAGAGRALGDVLAPLLSGGALLYALAWALAALVAPWVVRGRWLAADLVAAAAWAGALAAGTAAAAQSLRRARAAWARRGHGRRRRRGAGGTALSPRRRGGAVTPGWILCTGNHGHGTRVAAHERAAQPRIQARRARRGHVLARLQVRGSPGGDRAQARQGDGRPQGAVALARLRAERVRDLALARRPPAVRGL